MTANSYICTFIKDHPLAWRELLEEKQIKVKEQNSCAIFNYKVMADFSDPIVQEARGIIIDTKTLDVVCFPFRKFGNSHEAYADPIDWDSAKVQEKVDGSIVKLWYDEYKNWRADECWRWSSNSCIDAGDAKLSSGYSVLDLIEQTDEWKYLQNLIRNDELDSKNTYIFELIGPMNPVVIKYDKTELIHIGTRDNITGKELGTGKFTGYIKSPKEYPLHSLDDCIKAAKELNKGNYPDNEGFVVVDKDFHRVKIKSPEYLIYHHAVNNGLLTKERFLEIKDNDDFVEAAFLEASPEHIRDAYNYYKEVLFNARNEALAVMLKVKDLKDKGFDRKEIALNIKDDPYSYFGFKALDGRNIIELLDAEGKKLLNRIPDFEVNKDKITREEEDEDIDLC